MSGVTDAAGARRMRLLEELREARQGRGLDECARTLGVDERTVRRDASYLQEVLKVVQGIELRRGRLFAARAGHGPGYFADQVEHNRPAKEAIARAIVAAMPPDLAVAITAGSTTYYVAREFRRAHVECDEPRNLIAFTNSLPVLLEMISAGISTGVVGEVYNADDCAFHSHEFRGAFQASLAIVGASGVVPNPASGTLDLFSHRAEEASFLKQLLGPVPEIVVAVDASKIGRRHPWVFTGGEVLAGKTVRLFTDALPEAQREALGQLTQSAHRHGCAFTFVETD
jgi:DeoR/GlpR family transcriptional regulator of sugar metabolism